MNAYLKGALLLGALAFACKATGPGASSTDPDFVVAELDGEAVTLAELDRTIAAELYEARAEGLDALIERRALAREAARRDTDVDSVLDQITSELDPITDATVEAFFVQHEERMPPGATLETLGPRIRQLLEAERKRDALDVLIDDLDVAVHLSPPRVEVAAIGPARGPADARVTIVSWSDYQCPYCKSAEPVLEQLLALYPKDVRVVHRHLPLEFHAQARPAAIAAVCADEQGRFWDYHAELFAHQSELSSDSFDQFADALSLDRAAFDACLGSAAAAERVDRDVRDATAAGATGTPSFNLNGIQWSGGRRLEAFVELVEQELADGERRGG